MKSFIRHGKKFKSYLIALRDQAEKDVAHMSLVQHRFHVGEHQDGSWKFMLCDVKMMRFHFFKNVT